MSMIRIQFQIEVLRKRPQGMVDHALSLFELSSEFGEELQRLLVRVREKEGVNRIDTREWEYIDERSTSEAVYPE
jgi:hypothetical protein